MSCVLCGQPLKRNADNYCSRKCYGEAARARAALARDVIARECSACGVTFTPPRNSPRATCSSACRYALVSARHKAAGTRPLIAPSREVQRERIKGANAPWWKGGRMVNDAGYVVVIAPDDFPFPEMLGRNRRIREHRMIMALTLGRALSRQEVVHHVDHNPLNNDPSNLVLFSSQGDHKRHHKADGEKSHAMVSDVE